MEDVQAVFFPTELDCFLRHSGSGEANVDISPDVSCDISVGVSTIVRILASTLS